MSTIGKKNIVFGLSYLLVTLGIGMFLASKVSSGDQEWLQSHTHKLLKAAHGHGNMEAILNILFGFLICQFGKATETISKIASILLLATPILHSATLLLGALGVSMAMNLTPLGAVCLVAAVALMIPVVTKGLVDE